MVIAQGEESITESCHSIVNRMSDASLSLFTSVVFVSGCSQVCECVRARAFVSTFCLCYYTTTFTSFAMKSVCE